MHVKSGSTYPAFRYDGNGYRARIGLIFMASSIVMESEMWAMAAEGVAIHTTRIALPKVTVEGIEEMMNAPELERAAQLIGSAPIDVLCFGGTSASFLHGTSYDRALTEKLSVWAPGPKITTASTASLAALAEVGAGAIALATPYVGAVHQRAVRFLEENGHPIVSSDHLDIDEDRALAEVHLETVFDLACSVDRPEATAVFISCTNFWSVGVIEALEQQLKKPVVSAVQASFWHCLDILGVDGAKGGFGSLLTRRLAASDGGRHVRA